jgi:RNA polymerase sigma factor (sigma-70 family)
VNIQTDQQLLQAYAAHRSEAAFAELVRRHVDLVYSAALRLVHDAHLAEDVTQSVFVALAQSARPLTARAVLAGWLHVTTRNLAANLVRSDVRRRARESRYTGTVMNEMLSAPAEPVWQQLAPQLDAALGDLGEADRDTVLLRYFQGKSAHEMAQALGTSEAAAQKRLNRAVERLRTALARRGVAVGAGALVAVLSAHAVQAAPVGLAVSVCTAATLAGTAVPASAAMTATQILAMTTIQKTVVAATLLLAVGTGIHQAQQAATLRGQVKTLQQQQTTRPGSVAQLIRERDEAVARQTALQEENERLRQATVELPKLRGEVARLRALAQASTRNPAAQQNAENPFLQSVLALTSKAVELNEHLQRMPNKSIPELAFLTENDWLAAARDAKFDTEEDVRRALGHLRSRAKERLPFGSSLYSFTQANNGALPTDLSKLKPFFQTPVEDSILNRYKLLHTGKVSDFPEGTWFIVEEAPVDKDYDSRAKFGLGTSTVISTGKGEAGDPEDKAY